MKKCIAIGLLAFICLLTGCMGTADIKETSGNETTLHCPEIEETTLIDNEDVTITIDKLEYSAIYDMYAMETHIQNHSTRTLNYSSKCANVNGYTISALALGDVYGGMEADVQIGLPRQELQLADIKAIQEIGVEIECVYDDNGDSAGYAAGTILTSAYGTYTQEHSFTGTEAYNTADYRIVVAPSENPTVESPVIVFIENHTDFPIMLFYDSIAINQKMAVSYMSGPYVMPHSCRLEQLDTSLFGNNLEEEAVETTTLSFVILPYRPDGNFSTADTIETPTVTVKAE